VHISGPYVLRTHVQEEVAMETNRRTTVSFTGLLVSTCKYGENPYQLPAGLFEFPDNTDPLAMHKFMPIEGTPPSYINVSDVDRLLQTMTHIAAGFEVNFGNVPKIAIGVKHGNPCGVGIGEHAIERMLAGDPIAIFGGVVMTNFPIDSHEAIRLRYKDVATKKEKRLLDAVIAPSFTDAAVEELVRKEGKCRLIVNPALANLTEDSLDTMPRYRMVRGGFLRQPNYTFVLDLSDPRMVTHGLVLPGERPDLVLAWAIGATSNSNTITLIRGNKLIGNGVGQQDRVGAAKLAVEKAIRSEHLIAGAVAYSDSFFPFPDGPLVLADAGVRVIFASSGSVRDKEVIEACRSRDVTLCLMPDADCRGFYSH
jgi:phosphoribosylaminoimidazolecarboxamide formyltransferase/IMP cyclohydrolase